MGVRRSDGESGTLAVSVTVIGKAKFVEVSIP
jgi:hypothetical protein